MALLIPFLWLYPHKRTEHGITVVSNFPFEFSNDTLPIDISKYESGETFILNDTIDLQGRTWYLPPNISIIIKDGLVRNGNVVGNNTKLEYVGVVFDSVHIKGLWRVQKISTTMFSGLNYDNSLKDVFALANPAVNNTIIVEPGTYQITATKPSDRCIVIKGNADVTINGDIILTPNDYENYNMLRLNGDNILVQGNGSINGDKDSHLGEKGEWGMGIEIIGGRYVHVNGLSINNCWGDCIYIAGRAKKVLIENCKLDNGRRQGISVCSADSVYIRNCFITNVSGTLPERAIDVEPNDNESVNFVSIDNVQISHCVGGIMSYREQNNTSINTLIISNCYIEKTIKAPMGFTRTGKIIATGNRIVTGENKKAFYLNDVGTMTIINNTINGKRLRNNKKGYSNLNIKGNSKIVIK